MLLNLNQNNKQLPVFIRHKIPLMFDVIDDKPEQFIIHDKHQLVGRGFINYTLSHQS